MSTKRGTSSKTRRRYTNEYKAEVLALAERVGVAQAAAQLELQSSQIYTWRSQAESRKNRSAAEQAMATENAQLKRQIAEKDQEIAILKKATVYFARNLT